MDAALGDLAPRRRAPGRLRTALLWWAGWSAVGSVVLAMPDRDDRVVSLSETHGPSAVDLLGVLLLLVGWVPVAVRVVRTLTSRGAGRRAAVRAGVGLGAAGGAVLAVTVARDLGWWWIAGVALLVAAQLGLVAAGPGRSPGAGAWRAG